MINVQKTAELTGHSNPIFTLELSQKPGIAFTGGNDKGLVEWSLKNNSFIKVMFPVTSSIYAIHCPSDLPLLFAGLRNGNILVYDFVQQKIIHTLTHHSKPIFDIKSIHSKNELLVASEDGTVSVWDMKSLSFLHQLRVSNDTVRCIAVSSNATQVSFGCRDSSIVVYDLIDYTLIKKIYGHSMAVFTVQYSPDGTYFVSGSRDAQIKVWDTSSFSEIKNIPAHMFAVNHIIFHPDKPYFASASMDKSIKIWGTDDLKLYKIISREKGFDSHQLSINKLAWSGDQLLSVSDDKRIISWNIEFN